jgi:hypothetical protein
MNDPGWKGQNHKLDVYALPDNSFLDDARACARDYLACYLGMLDAAEKITDQSYRRKVETASLNYCDQLSEKDGSRKMLARFMGADKADRIFREVIRQGKKERRETCPGLSSNKFPSPR